jgi:hypothetical protein
MLAAMRRATATSGVGLQQRRLLDERPNQLRSGVLHIADSFVDLPNLQILIGARA